MTKTRTTNYDEASATNNVLFNDPVVQHIALVVLGLSENDPLCHAISQNIDSIEDILDGRAEDFKNLPVVMNEQSPQPLCNLKPMAKNKLLNLQRFALHRHQVDGENLNDSFWLTVTKEELQDFRLANMHDIVANNFNSGNNQVMAPLNSMSTKERSGVTPQPTLCSVFQRSIKRDMSLFPILKDEKKWDNFLQETTAQAAAQGVEEVLDPQFQPKNNPDEQELFNLKQKFMFAVFNKTLKTDASQSILRKDPTGNAQKIFAKLLKHMEESTAAMLDEEDLLQHIITSRINDGKWRGTNHGYILHWLEQVRLYHSVAEDFISPRILKKHLSNALEGVDEFMQVRSQEELQFRAGGKRLPYERYVEAIESVAQRLDKKMESRRHPRRATRQVYHAYQDHNEDAYDNDEYDAEAFGMATNDMFGIDTTVLEINAAASSKHQVRLPTQGWSRLSSEGKSAWSMLSNDDKTAIMSSLTSGNTNPTRNSDKPQRGFPANNRRFSRMDNNKYRATQNYHPPRMINTSKVDSLEADLQEQALQIFHMGRQSAMAESESHQPTIADTHQETNNNPGDVAMDTNEQQSINAFFSKQPYVPGQSKKQALPPGNINRLMSPTKKPGPK